MKFYTNVQLVGDDFLVRGYDNGNYFQTREKFSPTLFMKSPKKSKYKTLSGETVSPVKPGSVMECRNFMEKYSAVENVSIQTSANGTISNLNGFYKLDSCK